MTDPDNSRISMAEFEELIEQSSIGRGRSREQRAQEVQESRMAPFVQEFRELLALDEPASTNLRRMAELVEVLRNDEEARPYWKRAAEAGDRDAVDYLAVLQEEDEDD